MNPAGAPPMFKPPAFCRGEQQMHATEWASDCRYIQDLPGHKDIKTTLIYTHVTIKSLQTIQSPLDQLILANYPDKKAKD